MIAVPVRESCQVIPEEQLSCCARRPGTHVANENPRKDAITWGRAVSDGVVLFMAGNVDRRLADFVRDLGFEVRVHANMQRALAQLRHRQLAGIVVDPARTDLDVLEFVLNVRDVDDQTPVLFLGSAKDNESGRSLRLLRRVFLVEPTEPFAQTAAAIRNALVAGQEESADGQSGDA